MKSKCHLYNVVTLLIALSFNQIGGAASPESACSIPIDTFFSASDKERIAGTATMNKAVISQEIVKNQPSMKFTYPANTSYPTVVLYNSKEPLDWSRCGFLQLHVEVSEKSGLVPLKMVISDRYSTNFSEVPLTDRTGYSVTLSPNANRYIAAYLNLDDSSRFGMQFAPGGMALFNGTSSLDLRHIHQVYLYIQKSVNAGEIRFGDFKLYKSYGRSAKTLAYHKFVDPFGQNARINFEGKLKSIETFAARRNEENAHLQQALNTKPITALDEFGGDTSRPLAKSTGVNGFFGTGQDSSSRWWLRDPKGNAFYAVGVSGVDLTATSTFTNIISVDPVAERARELMFSWLPAENNVHFSQFIREKCYIGSGPDCARVPTFSFYGANLYRKYGRSYFEDWKDNTFKRLKAWGFNSIGNSSDSRFYGEAGKTSSQEGEPYMPRYNITGDVPVLFENKGSKFLDPYDPKFRLAAEANLASISGLSSDKWLIGYLVDSELPWGSDDHTSTDTNLQKRYNLALQVLRQDSKSSSAKRAFVSTLQSIYNGDIGALNVRWNAAFNKFTDLNAPYEVSNLSQNPGLNADVQTLSRALAERYYQVVRNVLKKLDPNHLYLCNKFSTYAYTPESVGAAAKYCDVVSFDIYSYKLDSKGTYSFLEKLGKPVLITEFNFYGLDRGYWGGNADCTVNTQAERASAYVTYTDSVLENPAVVGMYWYKYVDDPLTGRSFAPLQPAENRNSGLVDVTDTPHSKLTDAMTRVNHGIYSRLPHP